MSDVRIPQFSFWDRVGLFVLAESGLLAAAALLGGASWTALCAAAIAASAVRGLQPGRLVALAPALVWPALFRLTGDRRLFFPYAMSLAAQLALAPTGSAFGPGLLAGAGMVAAFMLVRVGQRATLRVLAVELACSLAILGAVVACRGRDMPTKGGVSTWAQVGGAALAALAACGCLALF